VSDRGEIETAVRDYYGAAARSVSGCCNPTSALPDGEQDVFGAGCYDPADLAGLPADAVAISIGCANPVAVAELHPGEVVLDLGSGGGIDVLLSARRVGPTGKAYGLDMTDDMLELARANQAQAGLDNVEFLRGQMEDIPLPDASVDVVISNCVINLSPDKAAVFAEARRVLRPGGRLAVADVTADNELDAQTRVDLSAWAACAAGALTRAAYQAALEQTGFTAVSITDDHPVGDGLASVIVQARKPAER
jgi:SAM-dependent methyltransferase